MLSGLQKVLSELAELKEQISQLSSTNKTSTTETFPAFFEEVKTELIEKGIQEKYADQLIKRVYQITEHGAEAGKQEIVQTIKTELKRRFKGFNHEKPSTRKKNKVVLMVGGTGVGKTTSAMKLASHQEIYGKKEVTIISTDLYGPSEAPLHQTI